MIPSYSSFFSRRPRLGSAAPNDHSTLISKSFKHLTGTAAGHGGKKVSRSNGQLQTHPNDQRQASNDVDDWLGGRVENE